MKYFIAFLLLFSIGIARAQDSCGLRVSLLTCSPGSELYSIFGHSALRIVDSAVGTDIVYNYGTFEFDDPNFYSKFVRGKLLYFLSQSSFENFQAEYEYYQRSIDEQVLNLDCKSKKELQLFVFNNLREENKFYKYDFLNDNCTTRLRDIIEQYRNKNWNEGQIDIASGMTFRNAIHYYLNKGEMHWSKLGIDLLLGSRIDKTMANREAMFLPEFLEIAVDKTGKGQDSLVLEKNYPLTLKAEVEKPGILARPETLFSLLLLLVVGLSFGGNQLAKTILKRFDQAFFLVLGLLGCLFLFMWFGTDHKQTADNFNLLWAWPFHLVAAFVLNRPKPNVRRYFFIYFIVTCLTLLLWVMLPQQLNPALIPVLLIAAFRSWKIYKEEYATNYKQTS